ncbi:hypothetical protein ALC57_03190 [Trachymyrmex cornetzi]|uniref:Chromo domain-containing protein n=1 Tax=Trachymyrmex cornetzi TaxID=471704 RepID=A0A151JMK1_9HYME|nr:hypothetical protein ALC57_03190 [Trachymyrmex cornetzi]
MRRDEIEKSRSSTETLRNYVYNNGLCLNPDHYDAKKRKIEHMAAPEFDTDAVNKSYVERTLRDKRNEIEESCEMIRRDMGKVQRNVEEIQRLIRDVTARMKNVVTNATLEKSFETTGRDMIVRALRDTQKDISNAVEKVRNNVEEVSKSVSALSMKVSNEIQHDVTDLRQQMHNIATKEMLETNEIQRGVTDLRQQMNNMVTKETLEKSFKTTGRDIIVRALQDMQKDNISNDVEKVRNNVEKVSKSVRAYTNLHVSNEIHRDVTARRCSHVKIAAPTRFKIGDPVRISKFKTIFEKGYTSNWSTEIFYTVKTQRMNPATYLLKDYQGKPIAGRFYERQLQRVSNPDVYLVEKILRKRGNKVYVKWLGQFT